MHPYHNDIVIRYSKTARPSAASVMCYVCLTVDMTITISSSSSTIIVIIITTVFVVNTNIIISLVYHYYHHYYHYYYYYYYYSGRPSAASVSWAAWPHARGERRARLDPKGLQ